MEIKIGEIIMAKHLGDNTETNVHPFLIINVTKKNIYGIQMTSVKTYDEQSYFSRENIDYFEYNFSNLEYLSHIRLGWLEFIEEEDIKESLAMSMSYEFIEICEKLLDYDWENDAFLSIDEIIKHIKSGREKYGEAWEIE